MTSPDFEVRLAREADTDGVLAALGDGYARPFTSEWFRWKHVDNPWGRSRCWVAEDDGGLLGVVFGMPWRLSTAGRPITCRRLVDGATTVRAQRRGVFRAVVKAELDTAAAERPSGLVIATATPDARDAHVKNGAVALEPIRSYHSPVRWASARLVTGPNVLDSWSALNGDRLESTWDGASLRWRIDGRSDVGYQVSQLAHGASAHGAIHRTAGGAVRTLVLAATWGDPAGVDRLVRALAWQSKAVAVLAPAGPGAVRERPRVSASRGQSLLCVWDQRSDAPGDDLSRRGRWALDGLDLEGVM